MNILIVEDDVRCAQLIGEIIERWGHGVEKAKSGKEAIKRLTKNMFDLVFLEISLPDTEGYELIPQFKKLCPEIGIVTITGHNSRELEMQVRKQGILYYMIKPFETKDLKCLLDHLSIYLQKKRSTITGQGFQSFLKGSTVNS